MIDIFLTMNLITDISPYLNESSRPLWQQLNSKYNITVRFNDVNEYSIYSEGQNAIILVDPTNESCVASFAHELLHLLIRSTQTYAGSAIALTVHENPILQLVMTDNLLNHIGNCLDHAKMLPLYLEMGFERNLFIKDYEMPKLTTEELELIQQRFRQKHIFQKSTYNPMGVDFYIGKFFAIKACPNNTIDYSVLLYGLEEIDRDLWQILNNFWISWLEYDVFKKRAVFEEDYHELTWRFTDSIKNWLNNRKIKFV